MYENINIDILGVCAYCIHVSRFSTVECRSREPAKKTSGNLSTRLDLDSCQVVGISAKRIAFKMENTFSSSHVYVMLDVVL